jgi:hypothetical protein
MKRLIISEEEKNHILGLHKSKLLKENTNPPVQSLTPTQKLEKIQQAFNLTADAIIGKDTTRAIEDKLSKLPKQDGKTKYGCVVNHNHVKINDTGNDKLEYQIGDLVFSMVFSFSLSNIQYSSYYTNLGFGNSIPRFASCSFNGFIIANSFTPLYISPCTNLAAYLCNPTDPLYAFKLSNSPYTAY